MTSSLFAFAWRKKALYSHHSSRSANTPPVSRTPSIALDRLDVHDLGTERGEEAARRRARPPRGEVHDAKPGERRRVPPRRSRARAGRGPRARDRARRSRGADVGGGAGSPSIVHGRRGMRNVPVGSSTSTPRTRTCSSSSTPGPSETGATGTRSSAACSTMYAVGCRVVHARTIAFHSSARVWPSREATPTRRR